MVSVWRAKLKGAVVVAWIAARQHLRGESGESHEPASYEASRHLDPSGDWRRLAESAEQIRIAGPAFSVTLTGNFDLNPSQKAERRLRKQLGKALHSELDSEYRLEWVALNLRAVEIQISANTSYSRSRSLLRITRAPWPTRVDAAVEAMRSAALHVLSPEAPELELSAAWELGEMVFAEAVALTEDAPIAAVQDTLRDRGEMKSRQKFVRNFLLGLASGIALLSSILGVVTQDLVVSAYTLAYAFIPLAFLPLANGRLTSIRNEIAELKERLELRDLLDDEERRAFRLFQIHNLDLKRYYDLALAQRRFIFGLGSFCILLGSGVAVTALILLGDDNASDQQKLLISGIGAVGAILANFVAVIYLRMFRDTVQSMNTFHNRLVATHHLLFGNLLAARIGDRAMRDETLAAMAASVAHIDPGGGSRQEADPRQAKKPGKDDPPGD
jgi:hypothetical protein